ncbi:unnamed protein product [Hermetia illucens]|uniref:Tetratricopeptide repeat protein 37 n=2 Tax=Hermetia illucens TaxID=343691 RepID=A0A7R8UCW6_HERIL|nr:unnamed protein product [Hermetia illucens]
MSSKSVKNALKEAREFIKNKDFKQAIEKCQAVIKEDPKNYMGLVLMGAAYQDTDKKEAASSLRKAVNCGVDPTLALQGLANCADVEELPEIYRKLLKLVPDKAKEYQSKVVLISGENKIWEDCLSVLEGEVHLENTESNAERVQSAWLNLCRVFYKQTAIPEKWSRLYEKCLEVAVAIPSTDVHLESYKRYIKLLYNTSRSADCLQKAVTMTELYPREVSPLEWICKVYSENVDSSTVNLNSLLKNPIESYAEGLLNLNKNSSLGILAKAVSLYSTEKYSQARDLLEHIKSEESKNPVCLKYLAECYVKLGAYTMAKREYDSINSTGSEYVLCLLHDESKESLEKAVNICEELLKTSPEDALILYYLARALFNLNDKSRAESMLKQLKESGSEAFVTLLEADYVRTLTETITLLDNETTDSFEIDLLKGRKYLEVKEFEKALTCLLRATKQKPYYSGCFSSLGQLYSSINDWARARKCYEKCIYLNPMNKHAIEHLSGIYRKNEEWDLNYALLQKAGKYFQKTKWPLFQMGLHNLSLQKFDEAIDSFRSALRFDISDILCWEGLADAYYQRGSFNSAMKVYQKIIELDPENEYSRLQVGVVKLTLRMYSESIAAFTELLETCPDYLPALKGAAEAHYCYAIYLSSKCLFGRCKENLQNATDCLQRIFLTGKRDMIWLWRLLANVFVATGRMSPTKAFLNVSGNLAGQEEDIVVLEKNELFEFAGRFYTCAIKLNPEDSLLWHELSLCYYYFALQYGKDAETRKRHLRLAMDASKQSIQLQPSRWQNWNLLGVICTTNEINNLPLAQHCFIKALQIDKKSASAWTNLGILYLKQGEIKLANKAFSRGQQADTGFVNAWVGQAIIAERIGQSDEAMDLFRHCTQLEFRTESAVGYAYWVCNILSNPENLKDPRYKYAIENMHAVPVALDSINWYYGAVGVDATLESLSYLGFLNSRQSLTNSATKAFELAVEKASGPDKDKMLCNVGYSYLRNNQLQEAIKAFDEVSEASFKSYIGLALARFRASQFQDSYSVYNLALEWLANNETEKSLILVAMSSMVYAAQGEGDTKGILKQCINLQNPPIQALFSACALGIIHTDQKLIDAALKALKPYEDDVEHCHHIAFLIAQVHAYNNQSKKGLNHLISRVHAFPGRPLLRRVLADYLLHIYRRSKKHMGPASKIAESTVVLELRNPRRTKEMSLNASKYLAVASEAMKRVDRARSMKLAQRAIHLNPLCQEAWDVLVSCKS